MSLRDVDKAYKDVAYPDAYCIKSSKYKTSTFHGTKVIVMDAALFVEVIDTFDYCVSNKRVSFSHSFLKTCDFPSEKLMYFQPTEYT